VLYVEITSLRKNILVLYYHHSQISINRKGLSDKTGCLCPRPPRLRRREETETLTRNLHRLDKPAASGSAAAQSNPFQFPKPQLRLSDPRSIARAAASRKP
jgi:hypothetical protein